MSVKQFQEPELPDTEEIEEVSEYHPPIPMPRTTRVRHVTTNSTMRDQQLALVKRNTEPILTRHRARLGKPGWLMLAGMLIILALWIVIQQAIIPSWNWTQDQWHYGDSRVTQMDVNVGHDGTSRFVAEFYHGTIVILEISLNNLKDVHPYVLPGMIGTKDTPIILLLVQDVNHDGKPDLVILVQGSAFETILYNTGSAFSESEG